jgi:GAF domain-containing protein/HAMP domain-containing protein
VFGWDELGYDTIVESRVPAREQVVEDIGGTADELEDLLENSTLQSAPRAVSNARSMVTMANLYDARLLETVDVLGELAVEKTGALAVLESQAHDLGLNAALIADTQMLDSMFLIRQNESLFLITNDPRYLDTARGHAANLDRQLDDFAQTGVRVSSVRATQDALDAYLVQLDTVEQLFAELDANGESLETIINEAEPLWTEMSELAEQEAAQAQVQADAVNRRMNLLLGAGALLMVTVGSLVTFLLWRDVSAGLLQLVDAAERLEVGDLDARAAVVSGDEFGRLAATFNAMAARLQNVVSGLEEESVSRARRLETIADISHAVSSLRDPDLLLREVVELTRTRFGFYHAQVFLVDEAREYAVLRESTGESGRKLLERGHRLQIGSRSVIGQVTAQGEPVVALDTEVDVVHRRNELLPDTRSELALPLRIGDQVIGALDIQSVQPNAFSRDDVAVLQTMADQLAVAIRNAQLFEEAQAALDEVEALNRRLTGRAWSGFIARRDPDVPRAFRIEEDAISTDAAGLPPELLEELQHAPLARLEADGDSEMSVAVPIRVRGEVIGAFGFGGEELEHLTPEDLALIEAVAERVSIALENVRLFEQTQQQARREHLVNQITSKIVGSTDVNDILQITARELGKVLRSPKTSIQLHGDQDDES